MSFITPITIISLSLLFGACVYVFVLWLKARKMKKESGEKE